MKRDKTIGSVQEKILSQVYIIYLVYEEKL